MTIQISPRDWEVLSAYLDGELTSKERARLETKLDLRADLRAALGELRRTRAVLRSQPQVRSPRNFTLTPQMAGMRPDARPARQLFPVMRLTAVLASLLFVFVLLGDFLLMGQPAAAPMLMAESAPQMSRIEAESVLNDVSGAIVEKAVEEAEFAEPEVGEADQALGIATILPERAPVVEMPAAEAEGGSLPTEKTGIAAAPPATLAAVEPTSTPSVSPTISPEGEIVSADESLESPLGQAHTVYRNRDTLRVLEVVLAIMGITTGFVAFYLRPKRKI